jgi:hypothetical protein
MATNPNEAVTITKGNCYDQKGLSKREHFAALAMQGLLSQPADQAFVYQNRPDAVAREAVNFADALIAALNEGGER